MMKKTILIIVALCAMTSVAKADLVVDSVGIARMENAVINTLSDGIIEMCDDDQYRYNTKDMVHISNFKSPFNKITQIESGGFRRVNR